jgi:hypothetical protein
MSDAVLVALIMSIPGTIAAVVSMYNSFNIRRIEKNTNSISSRNEDIAKALGVHEGREAEKANPSK